MKKIITISAAALLCGAMMTSAKTADQLRIYLNPGHGSWTSNDRPMKTLKEVDGKLTVIDPKTEAGTKANTPDTTAFYETNTNIRKMLGALDKLASYGLKFDRTKNQTNSNPYRVGAALDMSNNIVMSHVKAGPYPHDPNKSVVCNRNLSEIREEVEVNNFDMFFSLHSNAATDGSTVNYHAIFYRGWYSNESFAASGEQRGSGDSKDTPDFAKGSIDMAKAAAKYTLGMAHQHWTARKSDAVGSGCVIGDAEFQHGGSITTNNGKGYSGYYGVLKHGVPGYLAEGYFHTYQPSRQRAMNWDADRMEGIQFVRGIADYFGLTKETTGDIYGVVRDINETFHHTYYTPQGSTNDKYLPLNGVTVTLKDKDGKEVRSLVTDNFYNGVYVFADVEPGTYTVEFAKEGYKMVDGENYTVEVAAATTSYPESWMIDANWEPPTVVYNDYEDPLADVAQGGAAGEYVMEQIFTDEAVADLDGLNIRRTILRNGNLYVLGFDAANAPVIKVLDAKTRDVKATVSTEGAEGKILGIGDIA
ncbi:MAG: carboxypeptidase-like regulatory domain-containing protein, partial [Muribaculaceae bacterium]|nr:carboxypeptidase-like regulatory domain-containing protein [Muribaculaceae bacterium]